MIETVPIPGYATYVFPTPAQVAKEERVYAGLPLGEEMVESGRRNSEALRVKYAGRIVTLVFPFAPYSDRQRELARFRATDFHDGIPRVFTPRMFTILAAFATHMTDKEFGALEHTVATAIIEEVQRRCEPELMAWIDEQTREEMRRVLGDIPNG